MSDPARDEMYVGYLRIPLGYRRFLRWVVPLSLWILCAVGFVWARSQRSPGTGVWDQNQPVSLRGLLLARPYPMLLTTSTAGRAEPVLLVEAGKFGGRHEAASLDGQPVVARGWILHRDGRRMLELEPDQTALAAEVGGGTPQTGETALGPATLCGEIVDAKCFLGAMKPGEGKTHKECATLCIRGGIPPMLVQYDHQQRASYTLLAGADGGPLEAWAQPFIGDLVEMSGNLYERGGLRILRVSASSIRRL